MVTTNLLARFARIGARVKVTDIPSGRTRPRGGGVTLDVQTDREGEFFEVVDRGEDGTGATPGAEVIVLDVQPDDRHLLLLVREDGEKRKLLCGHDERHWFVAAVPESAPVGTVRQAKEALKPPAVVSAEARAGLRGEARNRRKNAAFVRQGEWFFLPVPSLVVDEDLVLRGEPLRRGNSKAHWAEFCVRTGGEAVFVCSRYPNGVTARQYREVLRKNDDAQGWGWTRMQRNADVYVRGHVRHPDHKTIDLRCWHQVLMNRENQARAMRNVAFLD
jgi:hypothetical protein